MPLQLKRPYQRDEPETRPPKRKAKKGIYSNIHMILATIADKSVNPFIQAKIEELGQDMTELDEVAEIWQGYRTTHLQIERSTTLSDMMDAIRESDELDEDTMHVVCYGGRAGIVNGMYRWSVSRTQHNAN